MFCPRCGKEKPDDKRFCGECGVPLIKIVYPPAQNIIIQNNTGFSPDAVMTIAGILIILAMYLVPLPSQPVYGYSFTLAKTVEYCSTPFPIIHCNSILTQLFYCGWIAGVILIVIGLFGSDAW